MVKIPERVLRVFIGEFVTTCFRYSRYLEVRTTIQDTSLVMTICDGSYYATRFYRLEAMKERAIRAAARFEANELVTFLKQGDR